MRRRLIQNMAAKPETTISQVPGSGTTPPPPPLPQGFPFRLVVVDFFPTPQTPGSGGGEIGTQMPVPKGLNVLSGSVGPIPGGFESNED